MKDCFTTYFQSQNSMNKQQNNQNHSSLMSNLIKYIQLKSYLGYYTAPIFEICFLNYSAKRACFISD